MVSCSRFSRITVRFSGWRVKTCKQTEKPTTATPLQPLVIRRLCESRYSAFSSSRTIRVTVYETFFVRVSGIILQTV
ncbi:hypothetical protein SAMN06265222_1383 [Neorhodopirellula lusitana]|uniref:Uncharacterized protein n=1 Tax=Neorhodopirellula lusitana TaxID=445327 RepID=A0ABY1QWQ4_9BACT|nr:hypothetical protein SAMN06265222_1383 [Neorhodopirellula lusitana]